MANRNKQQRTKIERIDLIKAANPFFAPDPVRVDGVNQRGGECRVVQSHLLNVKRRGKRAASSVNPVKRVSS
jgi:hypothetical protein